jgi:hypothetical protein
MAILRFNIPNNLNPREVAYNALRGAAWWGLSVGVGANKAANYATGMITRPEVLTLEEMLQVAPAKTPYVQDDRNTISFKFGEITATLSGAKIDLTRKNTIVSTALAGRRGTVKEFIKAEDYTITISGQLINTYPGKPTAYPVEQLRTLISLLQAEDSIEVSSAYLGFFDVSKVVFSDFTFKQTEAKYLNVQDFKITLMSDDDVDLFKIEED